MNRYHLHVEPYKRGRNKNVYEYRAVIYRFEEGSAEKKMVWETITPTRKLSKSLGETQLGLFKADEIVPIHGRKPGEGPVIRRNKGMLGQRHTPETKAVMRAKMKARWAAGDFKGVKLGRPDKARREQMDAERAARTAAVVALAAQRQAMEARGLTPPALPTWGGDRRGSKALSLQQLEQRGTVTHYDIKHAPPYKLKFINVGEEKTCIAVVDKRGNMLFKTTQDEYVVAKALAADVIQTAEYAAMKGNKQ